MKTHATLALCALALTGPSAGLAQNPRPPAPAPAADAAPIVLSEFRVDTSKDKGYLATNAISGTRLNTAIKDLPMPIEVVTSEFIQDIGAVDLKEALAYSAGIYGADNFTTESGGFLANEQPDTPRSLGAGRSVY